MLTRTETHAGQWHARKSSGDSVQTNNKNTRQTTHINDAPWAVANNMSRAVDGGHVEDIINTSPVARSRHGVRVPDALPHLLHADSPVLPNPWVRKELTTVVAVEVCILAKRRGVCRWRVVSEIEAGVVHRDDVEWASVSFGLMIAGVIKSICDVN